MLRMIAECGVLVASFTGAVVADEIPGWSDLTAMAKVSVIGFLMLLMGAVVLLMMKDSRDARREHAATIKEICAAQTQSMDANTTALGRLTVQCARRQTAGLDADRQYVDADRQYVDADRQHVDADRQHDDAERRNGAA